MGIPLSLVTINIMATGPYLAPALQVIEGQDGILEPEKILVTIPIVVLIFERSNMKRRQKWS